MKSTIEVDASRRLVRLTLEGPGSVEDCVRLLGQMRDRPDIEPGFRTLVDIRRLQYAATLSESRYLVEERERGAKDFGPTAIVVGDDLHHGTSRQFAALSELRGKTAAVFRDMVEAEVWLGVRKHGSAGEAG